MLLESVQIGQPKQYGDPTATAVNERAWETGFFKEPITTAVAVQATGLDGDGQADLTVHGGPDKAICVYPSEHFPHWHTSLGLAMQAGAFGENFTVADANESSVCIGDTYQAGDVIVQVSQPRQPCWKLARRWQQKKPDHLSPTARQDWLVLSRPRQRQHSSPDTFHPDSTTLSNVDHCCL